MIRFDTFNEDVVRFGPSQVVSGVLAEPHRPGNAPALVFLSAGLLQHSGPYRLWTDLARRFARQGFTSLRFDFTGLGNSAIRPGRFNDEQRAEAEMREAVELLEERGYKRVIFVGLCSGADYAHPYSLKDERVAGVVMFDAYGYPTSRFELTKKARLASPERFSLWSKRRAFIAAEREIIGAAGEAPEKPETYERVFPPREQIAGELRTLVSRGMKMLFVYTAGVPDYYNYEGQFEDMFNDVSMSDDRSGGAIEVEFYGRADHIFVAPEDREMVARRMEKWLAHYRR